MSVFDCRTDIGVMVLYTRSHLKCITFLRLQQEFCTGEFQILKNLQEIFERTKSMISKGPEDGVLFPFPSPNIN